MKALLGTLVFSILVPGAFVVAIPVALGMASRSPGFVGSRTAGLFLILVGAGDLYLGGHRVRPRGKRNTLPNRATYAIRRGRALSIRPQSDLYRGVGRSCWSCGHSRLRAGSDIRGRVIRGTPHVHSDLRGTRAQAPFWERVRWLCQRS